MREDFSKRLAQIVGQKRVDEIKQEASISAQIIQARHQLNWSQQNLADEIGVAKSIIGRIEAGLSKPSYTILLNISRALKTRFIIDGTEKEENDKNLLGT